MELEAIGRILTEATIVNIEDGWAAKNGLITEDQIRQVTVDDALVDTGATTLGLPTRIIQQLGLNKVGDKKATSSQGSCTVNIYGPVRLHLFDREMVLDAMEVPDDVPVLIGQIPLEYLDLVVDMQGRKLTGNPAHGGEHVLELY